VSVIVDMPESEFLAECRRWDEAILQHFVFDVPAGERVFLSIHEEVLDRLGRAWGRNSDDFLALVRRRWVRHLVRHGRKPRQEIVLRIHQIPPVAPQEYVTFLAAMVLAAHWMQTEVRESAEPGHSSLVIDETNYFKRLRQVLGLELVDDQVRPGGLGEYEDAKVWRQWTDWLEANGRRATARPGRGARRYINYPLSQTLLRDGDRSWLARRFWEEVRAHYLSRVFDAEMLIGWMQAHRGKFNRARLWQLLDHPEQQLRYEATVAAVFDVYSCVDWDADLVEEETEHTTRPIRRLTAGLYREEGPFIGDVTYSIYLRQPKGQDSQGLRITWAGVEAALRPERTGWFTLPFPSGHVPPNALTLKVVTADTTIREIVFPEREFWVLIGDPRAAGTGAFATWDLRPTPEQPFVLLCRPHLRGLLEQLREQHFIDWEGTPGDLNGGSWLEYRGCHVLGTQWRIRLNDLDETAQALIKKIRPEPGGTIRVEGGLLAPDRQAGWMEDYLPQVIVDAQEGFAEVLVFNLQTCDREPERRVQVNEPLDLPALSPGFYRIEAALVDGPGSEVRRHTLPPIVLSVRSWDSLEGAVVATEPA
jgi:hypothetical protein